jgi:glycosyltransferase involved in cell wall biosynthesis
MQISVIIPTYNRASFVEKALQSVLQQTHPPLEIIVVDDGSTDHTENILNPYLKNISYIKQQNRGVSAARNLGIKQANEQWIAFLDSDDLWKPKKLQKQIQAIEKKDDYKICYTNEEWRRNGQWKNQKKIHQKYSGWIYEKCLPLCILSPSSVIIHKSVFSEVGLFDENMPACEDYDLWLRITLKYPALFVDEKLIVKQAGDWEQLSKNHSLDKYRIIALRKVLCATELDTAQTEKTVAALKSKCFIYRVGCLKHNNQKELKWLDEMDQFLTSFVGKEEN